METVIDKKEYQDPNSTQFIYLYTDRVILLINNNIIDYISNQKNNFIIKYSVKKFDSNN